MAKQGGHYKVSEKGKSAKLIGGTKPIKRSVKTNKRDTAQKENLAGGRDNLLKHSNKQEAEPDNVLAKKQ